MTEDTILNIIRQIKELRTAIERLSTRDGNRPSKHTALTPMSSAITPTRTYHSVTTGTVNRIELMSDGFVLTLRPETTPVLIDSGANNIELHTGDYNMTSIYMTITLICDADLGKWLEISRSG